MRYLLHQQGLCIDQCQPLLAGARVAQWRGKGLILLLSKGEEWAAGLFGRAQQKVHLIGTSAIAYSLWTWDDIEGCNGKYNNNRLNWSFHSILWTGERQFTLLTQKQCSWWGVEGGYSIRSITSQGKILPRVRYEMWNFSGSWIFFGGIQWRVCFGSQAPNGKITSSLNLKWFLPIHNNLHLQGISKLSPTTSLSCGKVLSTLEHGKPAYGMTHVKKKK